MKQITFMSDEIGKKLIKKYDGWKITPLSEHGGDGWFSNPKTDWMPILSRQYSSNRQDSLVPRICGWCGNRTFVWGFSEEEAFQNMDEEFPCGTTCSFCHRNVAVYEKNWTYRAEFPDGRVIMQFGKNTSMSGGICGRRISQWKRDTDFPEIEWGTPNIKNILRMVKSFKGQDGFWADFE